MPLYRLLVICLIMLEAGTVLVMVPLYLVGTEHSGTRLVSMHTTVGAALATVTAAVATADTPVATPTAVPTTIPQCDIPNNAGTSISANSTPDRSACPKPAAGGCLVSLWTSLLLDPCLGPRGTLPAAVKMNDLLTAMPTSTTQHP